MPSSIIELKLRVFSSLGYHPHRGQMGMHKSRARFRIWAAAARVGKTYAAAHEVVARLLTHPQKQMIWVVAPTYILAEKIFRIVWHLVLEKFKGQFPVSRQSWKEKYIMFGNGSEIRAKSCERPEGLLGEGVNFMVIDEASRIPGEIYDTYLIPRLTTFSGDLLAISTPCGRGNRFHELYVLGMNKSDNAARYFESFHSKLTDNPLVKADDVKLLIETIGRTNPDAFKQEVLGMFIDFNGAVFPTYRKEVFFGDVKFNPNLLTEASIDVGTRAPTACIFMQKTQDGQIRGFEEYYKADRSSLQNARKLKPLFQQYKVQRATVDPREPDALMIYREIIPDTVFVPGPVETIKLTLDVLRDHLTIDPGTKKPRIIFDDSMVNLKMEFEKAHYPKGENEIPVDKDNHALSCLRYYLYKYHNFMRRIRIEHLEATGFRSGIDSLLSVSQYSGAIENGIDSKLVLAKREWMGDL